MTSILIRLPEGCALPTGPVLPEDVPIVAALLTDGVADPMLQLFPNRLDLNCVTAPDQGPAMPRLFLTKELRRIPLTRHAIRVVPRLHNSISAGDELIKQD